MAEEEEEDDDDGEVGRVWRWWQGGVSLRFLGLAFNLRCYSMLRKQFAIPLLLSCEIDFFLLYIYSLLSYIFGEEELHIRGLNRSKLSKLRDWS